MLNATVIRPLARGVTNAFRLLWRRDWREFFIRLRISLGHIDLKHDPTEAISERTHYYADSGGVEFDKIMSNFHIAPTDGIVDFGSGKGGILISLAKYPFAKIAGVEISPELVEIAKRNIRKLGIGNVEIHCCDAADFKKIHDYNYFYLFDPFPCVVMESVLDNLEASLKEHPRRMTIIYLNPFCHEALAARKIFKKTGELPHFDHKCFIYTNESSAS